MSQRTCPNSYPFVVFTFRLEVESTKEFGGASIKGKNKLLVPNLDSLWKHVGCYKVLIAMVGVKVGDHYFLKTNSHVTNEKLYFSLRVLKQCYHKQLMVQFKLIRRKKLCNFL